ncbi:uncharacterized protein LOC113291696 [Papaver somniferum]|uniref:uncharacterized protein LOC113291696 n=1 Tax=Papaver somniferum TaxID=3469 RepID=UPI000E6FC997|nr:uncharacterized protein LOC113291696 [Papaver somniferum]
MKYVIVKVQDVRRSQNIMLKQKLRNKWLLEGSNNSSFFHNSIKIRRAKFNRVDESIDAQLFEYEHDSITVEESHMLDAVPTKEEIKKVVFGLGVDSAPGPDGFSGCFYRHCWEIIQHDFLKIITETLASRLGLYFGKLVSEEQVDFMKGRNIHDNISLASEMFFEDMGIPKTGVLGFSLSFNQLVFRFLLTASREGNMKSLRNLVHLLEMYRSASGQTEWVSTDRYLGVQIMPGAVRYMHISNVIDKLKDQISVLKGKMLSFQDRVVLIKSVISSYSIHNMVVYKWSLKFIQQCERVIMNFLWSSDSNLCRALVVGYDKVCCPYKKGGLDLTRMATMNKALLMQLWWTIKSSNLGKVFGD